MAKPRFFLEKAREDTEYTNRQTSIINGEIPLDDIRINDLVTLLKKTKARHDDDYTEIVQEMLDLKNMPLSSIPLLTLEESMRLMQEMTPWVIKVNPPRKY